MQVQAPISGRKLVLFENSIQYPGLDWNIEVLCQKLSLPSRSFSQLRDTYSDQKQYLVVKLSMTYKISLQTLIMCLTMA